jgi:hypothetical protein
VNPFSAGEPLHSSIPLSISIQIFHQITSTTSFEKGAKKVFGRQAMPLSSFFLSFGCKQSFHGKEEKFGWLLLLCVCGRRATEASGGREKS